MMGFFGSQGEPAPAAPAVSSVFSPAGLSVPLVLWLDAAEGVTTSGSNVTGWANLAPTRSGYNATQTNAARQPAYSATGGVAGKPGVVFDGSANRYLELTGPGLGLANAVSGISMCIVYSPTYKSTEPETVIWVSSGTSASMARFNYTLNNSPLGQRVIQATRTDGGAYSGIFSAAPTQGPCWETVVADYANAQGTIFRNGLPLQVAAPLSTSGNTSATNSQIIRIGALDSGVYTFQGVISEILIWQGKLSAVDRALLDAYINDKYFNYNAQNTDYYVYVGDSNIAGLGLSESQTIDQQLAAILSPIPGISNVHLNYGLAGLKLKDQLKYLENPAGADGYYALSRAFLPNVRKKYLIIEQGTNDIWASTPTADIVQNYRHLVNFYQSQGWIVLPWTTLPLTGTWVSAVNALVNDIRSNYAAYGWVGYVEANAAVLAPPSADFQTDNAHLSATGVGKVAAAIKNKIESLPGWPYI
jgi:lysophospholipase L1-like esterase